MVRRNTSVRSEGPNESSALDQPLVDLMHALSMQDRPSYRNATLPLKNLTLRNANLPSIVRDANAMAEGMKVLGILLPPIVIPMDDLSMDDEHARFLVLDGRRRALGGRIAGLETTECRVYDAALSPQLEELITAATNLQRRSEWRSEVEALHVLVRRGLSWDLLVQSGFEKRTLKERLAIACLEDPLIEQITSGLMNQRTARRLAVLKESRRREFVTLAIQGEKISEEMVTQSYRTQVIPVVTLDDQVVSQPTLVLEEVQPPIWDGDKVADQIFAFQRMMQEIDPMLGTSEEARQVRFLFNPLDRLLSVLIRQRSASPMTQIQEEMAS